MTITNIGLANAFIKAKIPTIKKSLFSMGAKNRALGWEQIILYFNRHPLQQKILNKSNYDTEILLSMIYS